MPAGAKRPRGADSGEPSAKHPRRQFIVNADGRPVVSPAAEQEAAAAPAAAVQRPHPAAPQRPAHRGVLTTASILAARSQPLTKAPLAIKPVPPPGPCLPLYVELPGKSSGAPCVLVLGKPSGMRCRRVIAALSAARARAVVAPALELAAGRVPSSYRIHAVAACSKGRAVRRAVELCERNGVAAVNSSPALQAAYDKWLQYEQLSDLMPPTCRVACVEEAAGAASAVARAGTDPYPCIVKATVGSGGENVFLCHSEHELRETVAPLLALRRCVIVQQFIEESRGTDRRAFVVGGVVRAAMTRTAGSSAEFKANLAAGGAGARVELSPEEDRVAVAAAARLGLGVAGVDLLLAHNGPLVCEVNANPGMRIQGITGVNVAECIAAHALQAARGSTGAVLHELFSGITAFAAITPCRRFHGAAVPRSPAEAA